MSKSGLPVIWTLSYNGEGFGKMGNILGCHMFMVPREYLWEKFECKKKQKTKQKKIQKDF